MIRGTKIEKKFDVITRYFIEKGQIVGFVEIIDAGFYIGLTGNGGYIYKYKGRKQMKDYSLSYLSRLMRKYFMECIADKENFSKHKEAIVRVNKTQTELNNIVVRVSTDRFIKEMNC